MKGNRAVWVLIAGLSIAGCSSAPTTVAPQPPAHFEKLGPAEGSACGAMLLLFSSTNFIPAGLNDRVENAYSAAVASVPGATALIDVTMDESWYWWLLGSSRCVHIRGEAIR